MTLSPRIQIKSCKLNNHNIQTISSAATPALRVLLEPFPAVSGQRQVAFWTSCQSNAQTDKQPFALSHIRTVFGLWVGVGEPSTETSIVLNSHIIYQYIVNGTFLKFRARAHTCNLCHLFIVCQRFCASPSVDKTELFFGAIYINFLALWTWPLILCVVIIIILV